MREKNSILLTTPDNCHPVRYRQNDAAPPPPPQTGIDTKTQGARHARERVDLANLKRGWWLRILEGAACQTETVSQSSHFPCMVRFLLIRRLILEIPQVTAPFIWRTISFLFHSVLAFRSSYSTSVVPMAGYYPAGKYINSCYKKCK